MESMAGEDIAGDGIDSFMSMAAMRAERVSNAAAEGAFTAVAVDVARVALDTGLLESPSINETASRRDASTASLPSSTAGVTLVTLFETTLSPIASKRSAIASKPCAIKAFSSAYFPACTELIPEYTCSDSARNSPSTRASTEISAYSTRSRRASSCPMRERSWLSFSSVCAPCVVIS
ncbi:hypothetical protein BC830DRAFT_1139363 [Chytriomyces sp. MP71]|nr:hypothetical protein BC830DRAFT_1139363 [Chytriomyces sp. MP71]